MINKEKFLHRVTLASIFLISIIFLFLVEHKAVPLTADGVRFQEWSSDTMWQDLKSDGLREHPFKSLWYLHKQPPLYDAIRAVLVNLQGGPEQNSLVRLDQKIYRLWACVFGLMAVLIYQWLSQLTSRRFAIFLSVLWILHPSPVFYATYLDPTLLIALGVLWLFYELWRLYSGSGSIMRLAVAAVLLFYMRASFQWHFFVLMAFCLWLMKVPRMNLLKFAMICTLLGAPYVVKQYVLFKTPGSTFLGRHFYYLVAGDDDSVNELDVVAAKVPGTYPADAVLSVGKFNTEKDWRENQAYFELAGLYMRAHPLKCVENIARTFFVYNWRDYWRPSSMFQFNAAVSVLPWNTTFNEYLSYPKNVIILVLAILIWIKARTDEGLPGIDRKASGMFLLAFYVFLTSTLVNGNGKGWTEAVRYKFFLEPVYHVFIASQLYVLLFRNNKLTLKYETACKVFFGKKERRSE